jgi:predicted Rossmann fold nucleotide-binding protein DprA/Smf involved in DNA uptake
MEWVGITGSWRYQIPELQTCVEEEVLRIIRAGDAIVTGGALGVDYWATQIALHHGRPEQLLVILPTPLSIYQAHFARRAREEVISVEQSTALCAQLERVHHNGSLLEMLAMEVNQETYYARNTEVIEHSDAILAFQVNGSSGTQDTVDKAHNAGKAVTLFSFKT